MINDPLLWVLALALLVLLIKHLVAVRQLERKELERKTWKQTASKWAARMIITVSEMRKAGHTQSWVERDAKEEYKVDFNREFEL